MAKKMPLRGNEAAGTGQHIAIRGTKRRKDMFDMSVLDPLEDRNPRFLADNIIEGDRFMLNNVELRAHRHPEHGFWVLFRLNPEKTEWVEVYRLLGDLLMKVVAKAIEKRRARFEWSGLTIADLVRVDGKPDCEAWDRVMAEVADRLAADNERGPRR